jgi:hypothetical protein
MLFTRRIPAVISLHPKDRLDLPDLSRRIGPTASSVPKNSFGDAFNHPKDHVSGETEPEGPVSVLPWFRSSCSFHSIPKNCISATFQSEVFLSDDRPKVHIFRKR